MNMTIAQYLKQQWHTSVVCDILTESSEMYRRISDLLTTIQYC